MSSTTALTRADVVAQVQALPSLPRVVSDIMATVEDPDGSIRVLSEHVLHDPVITARVLSAANRASMASRRQETVRDIFAATSMIGMNRVREIALISSLGELFTTLPPEQRPRGLWPHCIDVAVCAQELAAFVKADVSSDSALVAGLLHDVGQTWFYATRAPQYRECMAQARTAGGLVSAERNCFGVDHAQVGQWLVEHWELPADIGQAIAGHHEPGALAQDPLVALLHVAEVLSNALNLAGISERHVSYISSAACDRLGLVWDSSVQMLFGRIEARSRHAHAFFFDSNQERR